MTKEQELKFTRPQKHIFYSPERLILEIYNNGRLMFRYTGVEAKNKKIELDQKDENQLEIDVLKIDENTFKDILA